jgi:N-terminal domain of anti-restriction factor ArdC
MAKFHTYSFGNTMLIARQRPDALNVAGLRTWNSLGRFVKRGEKGIFILAPMVGRRSAKDTATDEPSDDASSFWTWLTRVLTGYRRIGSVYGESSRNALSVFCAVGLSQRS